MMAEMNNSVYGNPSSLTIHNEKNMKSGKPICGLFDHVLYDKIYARLKYYIIFFLGLTFFYERNICGMTLV